MTPTAPGAGEPREDVGHIAEKDAPVRCGEHYARHPELVAVCSLPSGHDGEHTNVLPKTLGSLLGSVTSPAEGKPVQGCMVCATYRGEGRACPAHRVLPPAETRAPEAGDA